MFVCTGCLPPAAACRLLPVPYLQAQYNQEAEVQQRLKGDAHSICVLAVEAEAHGHGAGDLQGHTGTHT